MTLEAHSHSAADVEFAPDGRTLVSGGVHNRKSAPT